MKIFPLFTKEFWCQRVDRPLYRWSEFLDMFLTVLVITALCIWAFFSGAEWHKTYGAEEDILLLASFSITPEIVSGYSLSPSGKLSASTNSVKVFRVPSNTLIKQSSDGTRTLFISDSYQVNDFQINYNLDYYDSFRYGSVDDVYIVTSDSWVYSQSSAFIFEEYFPPSPTVTPSPAVTPVPDTPEVPGDYNEYFLLIILLLGGLLTWSFATRSPN